MMTAKHLPWRDAAGRFSPFKTAVLLLLFVPACWVAIAYATGTLGARPLNEAIHEIGRWTIRLLFLSLAVTPLRQALSWPQGMLVRRMIGVGAFAYAVLHLLLYAVDQAFDLPKIATEIAIRIYLLIGFVALAGLSALAATSTNAMVRRLGGRRWQRLHRLVYPIAILAVIHQFLQSKANVVEPSWMAGLLFWLLAWRLIAARCKGGRVPLWATASLGIAAAALTGLGEAIYFHLKLGAPLALVLEANFAAATGLRPAWVVAATGLALLAGAALRRTLRPAAGPRGRPAAETA